MAATKEPPGGALIRLRGVTQPPPPPGPPPAPQPPTPRPGPGVSGIPPVPQLPAAERIRLAYQQRNESDYIFDYWSALGWTILTFGIYGIYVFYQVIRRDRDHNLRRLELLDASIAFAWEEAEAQGKGEELRPNFERAQAYLGQLRQLTTEFRDPVIWLVIYLVGSYIAVFVGFYLVDTDLIRHDTNEGGVEAELATIFATLGQPLPVPDPARVKGPDNIAGRVVASIFSFGFYLLWWYHDIFEEGNRHFRTNWVWEDSLVGAVQAMGPAT